MQVRLGVLDVGSNTIHLQVMDAHIGARPTPTTNFKVELRLTQYLDEKGTISEQGITALHDAIEKAIAHANENHTVEILAFATSAIRDAKNSSKVIAEINERHEIDLQILGGEEEAQLTFLAARRWLGWSAGRLLVLDIGGGSLEIAVGDDESPEYTISLPLGAARMTHEFLSGDPYSSKSIKNLEYHIDNILEKTILEELKIHCADHVVATSKTFRTLARLAEHWYGDNQKDLKVSALLNIIPKLGALSNKQRVELPGISSSRAGQILAGGLVARAIMEVLELDEVEICPWALREGIILKRLDWMEP